METIQTFRIGNRTVQVSEGLNSVETASCSTMVERCHTVSEGLNSVETLSSSGRHWKAQTFQKDLIVWKHPGIQW